MKKIIFIIVSLALFSSCKNDLDLVLNKNPYDTEFQLDGNILEIEDAVITSWNLDNKGDTITGEVTYKVKLNPEYFDDNDITKSKCRVGIIVLVNNKQVTNIRSMRGNTITFYEYYYYLRNKNSKAVIEIRRKMTDNSLVDKSERNIY